jgi:hypothetical protein
MNGSRKDWVNSSISEAKLLVAVRQAEDAGTAIAIERLEDDVPELGPELPSFAGCRLEIRVSGMKSVYCSDVELLRRIAHFCRIVHHQRLRVDALRAYACR